MASNSDLLRNLPGVDNLLKQSSILELSQKYNADLVKYCIRSVLRHIREDFRKGSDIPGLNQIISKIKEEVEHLAERSLKRVINATGVIVHTNLGRSPFSDALIEETAAILKGYNNLEFDLETGERETRYFHILEILKYLTEAEDILVVNNNAAAVMMILRAFARNREVIVSRGELIEIGGSFRLPDIMMASDCIMKEVGTTNKTRIQDYANAINESTALLFKAHRSNYEIRGFTQEATLQELVALGKKNKIPVIYDMGSGLLRKTGIPVLENEPDVKETLNIGVDLVTFSGDKLLGAAQAGIIAGKHKMIAILKKEPLLRALRVGKTTLALLDTSLRYYLNEKILLEKNNVFRMMTIPREKLQRKAEDLHQLLAGYGISCELVESQAWCGGGALPGESIPSLAVRLLAPQNFGRQKSSFAELMHAKLMAQPLPIIGILKKGMLDLDILTIDDKDIPETAKAVHAAFNSISRS
ncbi:MAG: L-seryl-tRNA(Sec) selenium transferase [Bacteroidetes bacterium]|nr:L-seryl-tRNA(Sec) selenium transferase [Bacteroidota bacterium]